jgi:hypothetical protein
MTNKHFDEFIAVLNNGAISLLDNEVIVNFAEAPQAANVKLLLEKISYEFDNAKTFRKGILTLSLNAEYWQNDCPLFHNWEQLYKQAIQSSSLPEEFLVIENLSSCLDDSGHAKKIELFCQVRRLLAQLSDHCEPEKGVAKGSKKLLFIIETNSNVCKHEFKPIVDWDFVSSIPDADSALESVEKLISFLNVGDRQDTERRSVMRSALNDLINTCSGAEAIFPTILKSVNELLRKYDEHHELFVKRFSVNKVLHEINEQDLNYTSKINEIISSAQNKALAIPGALIAIGAIMKIDHLIDGFAVAVGILITTIIVNRSLNVHQATFTHIKKQVDSEFKRYDTLNENADIRKQAKATNKALSQLLKDASDNALFIKRCIWGILLAAFIFIGFSASNIKPTTQGKSGEVAQYTYDNYRQNC